MTPEHTALVARLTRGELLVGDIEAIAAALREQAGEIERLDRAWIAVVAECDALRKALTQAVEYVEADSSERFAELAEWRAALGSKP